jgi:hypothetical protein
MTAKLDRAAEAARFVLSSPRNSKVFIVISRCGLGFQAVIQGDAAGAAEQYANL